MPTVFGPGGRPGFGINGDRNLGGAVIKEKDLPRNKDGTFALLPPDAVFEVPDGFEAVEQFGHPPLNGDSRNKRGFVRTGFALRNIRPPVPATPTLREQRAIRNNPLLDTFASKRQRALSSILSGIIPLAGGKV